MSNRKPSLNAVGVSSLLVIFAVLCLAVFALLSVSTVQAQMRLAESTRSGISGYYRADCAAETVLSQLRSGKVPEGVEQNENIYTYVCPISDTQAISVCVEVEGTDFTIHRWQTVSTVDWETEDRLPVWDGQQS